MTTTFLWQFVNMFLIMFLVKDHKILAFSTRGIEFQNVTKQWYISGTPILIKALCFNILTPQLDLCSMFFIKWISRIRDSGSVSTTNKEDEMKTKSTTIMQYVRLYSGPNYEIFMKYAFMMKFIAISFVFGYSLPVLFPITFLALVNLYITDKYALAYLYQKPPNYDGKIIIVAI